MRERKLRKRLEIRILRVLEIVLVGFEKKKIEIKEKERYIIEKYKLKDGRY